MATIEIPDTFNLATYLADRHVAEGRGSRVAIYHQDQKITYSELAANVNRTGNVLTRLGLEMENRLALVLPDCPEFFYGFLGAMKIGAVPVPINAMALPKEYAYFLNDSRAKILIVHKDLLAKIEEVKNGLKYLKHTIVVGGAPAGYVSYESLLERASDVLEPAPTSKDDVAFWLYTSGTTGVPKGVVHLHHDLLHFLPPYCEQVSRITQDDIVFTTSKMFFSYGKNNSFDSPLFSGAGVILHAEWPDPAKVFEILQKYRPTIVVSVPAFYNSLLRELDRNNGKIDLSFIRVCISSGEHLPKPLFDRWKDKFGLEILDVLGSTDAGGSYIGNCPGLVKPSSKGILLNGFEGKLIGADGNEVAPGDIGTLWLNNDGTAPYYWNKHHSSKKSFQGDWFNTGDRFHRDEDGFMWFEGREDDMLKASGQWVSPLEIEAVLGQHPAASEVAVVGAPDESGLTRVKAFVVLKKPSDASPALEKKMISFVRDRIAHFKAPRWVEFVPELPRTATGKLQRHKLKAGHSS